MMEEQQQEEKGEEAAPGAWRPRCPTPLTRSSASLARATSPARSRRGCWLLATRWWWGVEPPSASWLCSPKRWRYDTHTHTHTVTHDMSLNPGRVIGVSISPTVIIMHLLRRALMVVVVTLWRSLTDNCCQRLWEPVVVGGVGGGASIKLFHRQPKKKK